MILYNNNGIVLQRTDTGSSGPGGSGTGGITDQPATPGLTAANAIATSVPFVDVMNITYNENPVVTLSKNQFEITFKIRHPDANSFDTVTCI